MPAAFGDTRAIRNPAYRTTRLIRFFIKFVCKYFQENDVYRVKDLRKEPITVGKKIIYFNKFNPGWTQPIPLLLSTAGMMHGGEKSMLLQRAEKVVYFAADVYNNQQRRA